MLEFLFYNNLDVYIRSILEDIFSVVMVYSFFKMLLLSIFVELLWPTQFFNKKHSSLLDFVRRRTYIEHILKNSPLTKSVSVKLINSQF